MQRIKLIGIQSKDIDNYWHLVRDFIAESLRKMSDNTKLDDIYSSLITSDRQLWVVYDRDEEKIIGCILTSILVFPEYKKLLYYVVSGKDFKLWRDYSSIIENWAKSKGCTKIEMCGRLGWRKYLDSLGFRLAYIGMEKDL